MKAKLNKEQTLNIAYLAVAILLVVTLVVSTIIYSISGGSQPNGEIKLSDFDRYILHYDSSTRIEFKDNFRIWLFNYLDFVGLEKPDFYLDMDYLGMGLLLDSLEKAGISADKVIRISEFFRDLSPKDPIMFDQMFFYAGITSLEIGTFFYEHQLMLAQYSETDEKYNLLKELGKENYISIITDPFELFAEFGSLSESINISPADGRMAREALYAQGAKFDKILKEFGAEKIELLFGVGADIVSEDFIGENSSMNQIEADILNSISKNLQGLVGYFLRTTADTLMSLPPEAFESLVQKINTKSEKDHYFTLLSCFRTIEEKSNLAMQEYGIEKSEIVEKAANLLALVRYIEFSEEENPTVTFEDLLQEEMINTQNSFNIFALLADEKYKNIESVNGINNLSEADYLELKDNLDSLLEHYEKQEKGLKTVASLMGTMLFVNTILGVQEG